MNTPLRTLAESALLFWAFWAMSLSAIASSAQETPAGWLLAHVDVETTGLRPGYHEMIDLGMIITDLDGVELDRLFIRIMPAHPERIDPGAAAVNGFSVELWQERGCVTEAEAVTQIFEFLDRVAQQKTVLFTGFNAWFDLSFVDALLRSQDREWRSLFHYFILDIPSMAWGQELRGLTGQNLADSLGIRAETSDPLEHTGITGADFNVALYRKLIKRLDARPTAP